MNKDETLKWLRHWMVDRIGWSNTVERKAAKLLRPYQEGKLLVMRATPGKVNVVCR